MIDYFIGFLFLVLVLPWAAYLTVKMSVLGVLRGRELFERSRVDRVVNRCKQQCPRCEVKSDVSQRS